jgi:hypothetical protein
MHYHDGTVGAYKQKKTVADRPNPPYKCQVRGGHENRSEGYADYKPGLGYFDMDEVYITVQGKINLKKKRNGKMPTMEEMVNDFWSGQRG